MFHRTGTIAGLRKEVRFVPTKYNLPFPLWSQLPSHCFSDPRFSGAQPDGRLGWVLCLRATHGKVENCVIRLFQCLPASVRMLARNIVAVELPYALSQMAGSPPRIQADGRHVAERGGALSAGYLLKENLLCIRFKYRSYSLELLV